MTEPNAPTPDRARQVAARLAGIARRLTRWCARLVLCSALATAVLVWAMLQAPGWADWLRGVLGAVAALPTLILGLYWMFLSDLVELPERLGRAAAGARQLGATFVRPKPEQGQRRLLRTGGTLYELYDAASSAGDLLGRSGTLAFWLSPLGWALLIAGWIGANLVMLLGIVIGVAHALG